jgi:hypothetical protein
MKWATETQTDPLVLQEGLLLGVPLVWLSRNSLTMSKTALRGLSQEGLTKPGKALDVRPTS